MKHEFDYWLLFKSGLMQFNLHYLERLIVHSKMKCYIDLPKACQVAGYILWFDLHLDFALIVFVVYRASYDDAFFHLNKKVGFFLFQTS